MMVIRITVICLCIGMLSTITGCCAKPSPYESRAPYDHYPPYGVTGPHETPQGPDYEKQIDEEVQQYRQRRGEQEQEQERAYQQWEQERARERDPHWE